jgi:hypothetical protein
MAFTAQETANHGNVVIALLEDESAGDQARAPFINFVSVLATVCINIFLRNAVNDGANLGPHAGTGAHGAGFVCGVEDEVGKVAAITAAHVFEHFQLDVFDAGSRSFYPVSRAGDDRLTLAGDARNDRANRIVAAVAGAFGLCNSQFHEFLFRLVRGRNHAFRLYEIIASGPQDIRGAPVHARAALQANEGTEFT